MSQIKAGAVLSYTGVAFNTIAGLLYTPWMVSCVGVDNYGLYTLALSVINFFLLDFGLSESVSRYLSKYYAEGEADRIPSFLGVTYKMYLVITLFIAVVLLGVFLNIDAIYSGLTREQLPMFRVLFIIISLYSVVSFPFAPLNGILVSNERFVALNACNLVQKVLTVLLIVAALLLGQGIYALVAANAFVSVVITIVKLVLVHVKTDVRVDFSHGGIAAMREVVSFSAWVMVTNVCGRLIFSIMPTIIAATSTSSEVALFGLASSLEGYVYTVASALNGMFMPRVSRSLAGGDEGLQQLMTRVGRIQLYIIGFIFVCFASIGGRFVSAWMGPGYERLWPCTILLIVPSVIELPQLIGVTAITASGKVRAKATVYIVMSVTNVVLGLLLTRIFGALGACISICFAYLLRTAGQNVIYTRLLGIRVGLFFRGTYARWAGVAMAVLVFGCLVSISVPADGWVGFLACASIVLVVYAVLLWAFVMNDYEKELVLSLLHLAR